MNLAGRARRRFAASAKQLTRRIKSFSLKKEKVPTPVVFGQLLKGRTAYITGGTSGIGYSIAEAFVRNGASVAISGRSRARLDAAVANINRAVDGAQVVGILLDGSTDDQDEYLRALDEAEQKLGDELDILVNNAGIIAGDNIAITDISDFNRSINTNLRGAYFYSQAFAHKLVRSQRSGNILNICSSSSLRPAVSPYAVSKWGLRGLTLGLAKMLIPHGIVVNGIAPGPTATPMLVDDDCADLTNENVPAGRYATPEEIADIAVVLVSDLSRMIVGDVICMTGGCGNLTFDDADYELLV